jgi:3-dehydrotetronate 4-kinase
MTDANLVRVLQQQTAGKVGLTSIATVQRGVAAIKAAFERLAGEGVRYAIVDAIEDRHLQEIGAACEDMALITGGSGVALGLPENFRRKGVLASSGAADALPQVGGLSAVIAGSCSQATLGQIAHTKAKHPWRHLDALALAENASETRQVIDWALAHVKQGPVLVYASAPPDEVKRIQAKLGQARAGELIETALAQVATALVAAGVRKLVVAGGETSGAVVQALGVRGIRIGPQIDPGVPWTLSMDEPRVALALKSGNFGAEDFFTKALGTIR